MPVENEVKYVLRNPKAVLALDGPWVKIDQGYLGREAGLGRPPHSRRGQLARNQLAGRMPDGDAHRGAYYLKNNVLPLSDALERPYRRREEKEALLVHCRNFVTKQNTVALRLSTSVTG